MRKKRNIKSLYCVTGTSIVCRSVILQKQIHRKIEIKFLVIKGRGLWKGNWLKAVKRYILSVIK